MKRSSAACLFVLLPRRHHERLWGASRGRLFRACDTAPGARNFSCSAALALRSGLAIATASATSQPEPLLTRRALALMQPGRRTSANVWLGGAGRRGLQVNAALLSCDLETVKPCDGARETFAVPSVINAAHAQIGDGRIVDHQRNFVVAVHLGDSLRQHRLVQHDFAATPGCYRVRWRHIELRHRAFEREPLACRQQKRLMWLVSA